MGRKKIARIDTFDIMRGFFLVGIFMDHLNFYPNGLDWWAARGGLFSTMAEGFFIISGILLGIVRGPKLLDVPFRKVARLLLNRGFRLYAASVVLTLLFTALVWIFFHDVEGVKPDYAEPGTPLGQLLLDTFSLHYFYGWADYLRLYAVFILASPIIMWLLRRGWWYVGLLLSAGVWLLFPDPAVTSGVDQERAQLLSWQLLFFMSMTIGYHWQNLSEYWAKLSRTLRRTVLCTLWSVAGATLVYNVGIMLSTMGYNMEWAGITPLLQHDLYIAFFDKEQLPLTRIILAMTWFWAAFAAVRLLEAPIKRWFGWLLLTFGRNSLYVYIIHAFMIFFLHIYLRSGSILFNFMVVAVAIAVTLALIHYRILMRIIPR